MIVYALYSSFGPISEAADAHKPRGGAFFQTRNAPQARIDFGKIRDAFTTVFVHGLQVIENLPPCVVLTLY